VSDRRPLVAPGGGGGGGADLDAYRARRERLAADLRQVLEDFQALRAEPSFPGLEDTLATLAASS